MPERKDVYRNKVQSTNWLRTFTSGLYIFLFSETQLRLGQTHETYCTRSMNHESDSEPQRVTRLDAIRADWLQQRIVYKTFA